MAADEIPGDIYQSTEGVYLDFANNKIPTFRRHLTVNSHYVSMGAKIPLGLGNPERCTQAKALDTQFETYRAAMRDRYETAITLLNTFSDSLRDVEMTHREAEDDSEGIGKTLLDEFSAILTPKGK
ncbi:hypothetical protein [Streptomyces sp. DH8]|uniref:hypothetical protein n=1 Tax=Streptomyces sp. DH8 TaxID=2857008 RepID=UPI001E63A5F8|nr:hypothetical protein [Streptomyces sp. DH8]